ncbi:hypothetical protein DFP72DRAFT_1063838 [Ephemerocybe angulata]|uniref:Uncharacterized protein n=1 Tax=Ephemerocybe angulata TaxID=980116 RepID=A0A8H6M920_9AGAR|nr:hypothetical protein DFP72DRAFT_1063838 [Tulosesus angulatus]
MPAGFAPGGPFGKTTMTLGNGTTTSSAPADPHEWIIATFTSHVQRYMSQERAGTIRTTTQKAIDAGQCSKQDHLSVLIKQLSEWEYSSRPSPAKPSTTTTGIRGSVAAPSSPSPPSPVEARLITSVVGLEEGLEKMQEELVRLSNEVITLRVRTEEAQDIASKEVHSLRTSLVEVQEITDREFAEVNRSLVTLTGSQETIIKAVKADVVQAKSLANCAKRHSDDLRLQVDELATTSRVHSEDARSVNDRASELELTLGRRIEALDVLVGELQSDVTANKHSSELELSLGQRIDSLDARVVELQSVSPAPSPPRLQLPPSPLPSVPRRNRNRPPHRRLRMGQAHKHAPQLRGASAFRQSHGPYPIGQCPLCCSPLFVPHPAFRGRRMAMC